MWRRIGLALIGGLLGYAVGVIVSFTVFTLAHGSRATAFGLARDRDQWALIAGLAGLTIGAVVAFLWHPPASEPAAATDERAEGDVVAAEGEQRRSDAEVDDEPPGTGGPAAG